MPEQPGTKLNIDAVGGVRKDIGLQHPQHGLERRHQQQADDQHVERRKVPVAEHLIDHDLKKQGRDQPE